MSGRPVRHGSSGSDHRSGSAVTKVLQGFTRQPVLLFGVGLAVLLVGAASVGGGALAILGWSLLLIDVVGTVAWVTVRMRDRARTRG